MIYTIDACITYSQVVVSWPDIPTYLIWTDEHVAQGFAWSPVRVAFGVPDHDGLCRIEVEQSPTDVFDAKSALWAIRVPFEVPFDDPLKIGSIDDEREVAVRTGRYSLVFAAYPGAKVGENFAFRLLLRFEPDADADFAILNAGNELTADVVLRKDADPI